MSRLSSSAIRNPHGARSVHATDDCAPCREYGRRLPTSSVSDHQHPLADGPLFPAIGCGVDGTRAGFEAVRQAALLARDGGVLRLLAVTWETGTRATAMVELGRRRATDALERAAAIDTTSARPQSVS